MATAIGNPNFKISSVLPQLASTPSGSGSGFSGGSYTGGLSSSSGLRSATGTSAKNTAAGAGPTRIPSSSPRYGSFLLTASSTRMLIPWVAGAGVLALIGGALVLMSGGLAQGVRSLRRRLLPSGEPPAETEDLDS